ncbi:MAG: hypothetical protein LN588_04175 [Rickettsia endosymbiont of Bryobia graminum]|nr:hypothetical protein [Rickettsia endosymbiont of Bryobia graminum]
MEEDNIYRSAEDEEGVEARLDREESARKFRAIIVIVILLLIAFLIFSYYFINAVEEKGRLFQQQKKLRNLNVQQ